MPRQKNDFYPTPIAATKVLLYYTAITGTILEPCSGKGDMAGVLKDHFATKKLITNDIDPLRFADTNKDATKEDSWLHATPDWVVTNPPFSKAIEILKLAHENAIIGVAMLLRLSFLEPTKSRGTWLQTNPPTTLLVLPRISFTGDGKTDSVTCAWFIWDRRPAFKSGIHVIPKKLFDIATEL